MQDKPKEMMAWKLRTTTPLRDVFEWCLTEHAVDRLLLSTRLDEDEPGTVLLDPPVNPLTAETFGDHILAREFVRQWPGTKLIGHDGLVYVIAFDVSLIEPMVRLGPTLEDWYANGLVPLPEDPCLYCRGEQWPVLFSVTHERDAWIIHKERPPFPVGDPFTFDPEKLFVPKASGGFLAT